MPAALILLIILAIVFLVIIWLKYKSLDDFIKEESKQGNNRS